MTVGCISLLIIKGFSRASMLDRRGRPGPFRLEGIVPYISSPVAAAGRVYVTDLEGATVVVRGGDVPDLVALSIACPNLSVRRPRSQGELFLRQATNNSTAWKNGTSNRPSCIGCPLAEDDIKSISAASRHDRTW